MHAEIAYDLKLAPRELKAWSQNLGHSSVLTSLGSYGTLTFEEQADVMAGIGGPGEAVPDAEVETLLLQLAGKITRRRGG